MSSDLPGGTAWPKISIVTPSFNQGRYIEETILSVLDQNYPNVEHIVMDAGSTDETPEILARYRSRLAHVTSEPDRGQSHAINKGMDAATGEILTWLNADDRLAPGSLRAVAMAFETSGAEMVAGICEIYRDGQLIEQHLTSCEDGPLPLNDILDLEGGWNAGQFFYQPEVMFKRSLWQRAGGRVDESLFFSMDYDLWARFAEAGARLHVIGRPLARFRLHAEQKTHEQGRFFAELQRARDAFVARTGRTWTPRSMPATPRRRLRIVMLNDHGFRFGAGVAHGRMAHALALAGHQVIPLSFARRSEETEGVARLPNEELLEDILSGKPDMILAGNIHSVRPDPELLYLLAERVPTLCMLHDFWLLTGRCPYPGECTKHLTGCDETCPTADEYPKLAPAAIAPAWRTKRMILESGLPVLLANSRWTADYARRMLSGLPPAAPRPRVENIQLSFPLDTFRPIDKQTCRQQLGLPRNEFVVLLTGDFSDRRKGGDVLLEALRQLRLPDLTLLSTAVNDPKPEIAEGLKIHKLGYIADPERLAMVFNAADVVAGPSSEETFGQIFVEAAACGVPSIGFATSGVQEALRNNVTGRLISGAGSASMAAAILEMYRNPEWRADLSRWARIYVENEWSPYAAYRQCFLALDRLGLREQFGMLRKIAFVPGPVATPSCRVLAADRQIQGEGLLIPEGPLQYNPPGCRWALGPKTSIEFLAQRAGRHIVTIHYRNEHPDQTVTIGVNGSDAGAFSLAKTGPYAERMLACSADLLRGSNAMSLQFARWTESSPPAAILITKMNWCGCDRVAPA